MRNLLRAGLALITGLALATPAAAQAPSPLATRSATTGLLLRDAVATAVVQAVSGDVAHRTLSALSLLDRSQVTPGFDAAAALIAERAGQAGLAGVEVEAFPADGQTRTFGDVAPRAWRARQGELSIKAPFAVRLASYADLPMSLARNSLSAHVEAELVDVGAGTSAADYAGKVLAGRVALVSAPPGDAWAQARRRGAVGVVSTYSVVFFAEDHRLPGDARDEIGWASLAEPSGPADRGFAFMISARQGEQLRKLLHEGPVIVRADVEAAIAPGEQRSVTAVLPGARFPREEILVTAHLDHYLPGANDNASGSAAILEMARSWQELIARGVLPPPLRTVRFLWVNEYAGSRAWLARHEGDAGRIVNFNLDMVGGSPALTAGSFFATYTPDAVPSYLNALLSSTFTFLTTFNAARYGARPDLQAMTLTGTRQPFTGAPVSFRLGSDHELFALAGKPSTLLSSWPDRNYHSSADSPDKIDPTALKRAMLAALLPAITIAYMNEAHVGDLARLSASEARLRLAAASAKALAMAGADDPGGARSLVAHAFDREAAAVRSSLTLAPAGAAVPAVATLALQIEALRDVELGQLAAVPPPAETKADLEARRRVPARTMNGRYVSAVSVLGEAGLTGNATSPRPAIAALNAARALARSRGADMFEALAVLELPAYYVDGQRTIDEIRRHVEAEAGMPFSNEALIDYFRAFEAAGAMRLDKRP